MHQSDALSHTHTQLESGFSLQTSKVNKHTEKKIMTSPTQAPQHRRIATHPS